MHNISLITQQTPPKTLWGLLLINNVNSRLIPDEANAVYHGLENERKKKVSRLCARFACFSAESCALVTWDL